MQNTPRGSAKCPFCPPVEDSDGHNRMLRENAHAFLILSNPHKMPGHVLVIPKRHVEKPWELTSEEILDVFALISFAQHQMLTSFAQGTNVRQQYLPFVPQGAIKVNHTHYHVFPRSSDDAMYKKIGPQEDELFEPLTDEERKKFDPLFS